MPHPGLEWGLIEFLTICISNKFLNSADAARSPSVLGRVSSLSHISRFQDKWHGEIRRFYLN